MYSVILLGMKRLVAEAAGALAPVLAIWALYRKALRLGWTYDDAFHLHQSFVHPVTSMLFDRAFFAGLPNRVFTPLLFVSLKLDLAQFGAAPRPYVIHDLVLGALSGALSYAVARLWLSRVWSAAVAVLIVSGPVMCEIVAAIYHRHYLEGLILSLGSVLTYVLGVRARRPALTIVSALLFFAAAACKEVYVPLPALLAVLPEGTWRDRMRSLIPHGIALAAYAAWRSMMLGFALSGYGLVAPPEDRLTQLLTIPFRALRRIGGTDPVTGALLIVLLLVALAIVFVRCPRSRAVILVGALVSLAPIVPVSFRIEPRYVLTAWVLLAFGAGMVVRAMPRAGAAVFVGILVSALLANRAEWNTAYARLSRMSAESRCMLEMPSGAVLLEPIVGPEAMPELTWMRNVLLHRPGSGIALYDGPMLCRSTAFAGHQMFEYYEPRSVVRPVQFERSRCARVRDDVSFAARIRSDGAGTVDWKLTPAEGAYRFVMPDGLQAFDVPARAGFRVGKGRPFSVIVRYTTPAGAISYSPELMIDPSRPSERAWRR